MNLDPLYWETTSGDRVVVFAPKPTEPTFGHRWYWHVKSANNQIIASSGESFTRKWSAKRAALRAFPKAENQ